MTLTMTITKHVRATFFSGAGSESDSDLRGGFLLRVA